jgi:phage recombination protein Bet
MSQVSTLPQQTSQPPSLLAKIASRYSVDPTKMLTTLKATAFKGDVSNEQLMALLIVADQYGLNPWTKELYAFPDRQNGIVPVIGVDGWSRIINSHDQFDGISFKQNDESCTCTIYRKDRQHPVEVTEWMSECKRNVGPWQSHPKRMLRHKAMIQCARLAFGFVGVYDQDEAERIVERDITPQDDPLPMTSRTEAIKARIKGKKTETVDQDTGEISDPQDEAIKQVEQGTAGAMSYAEVASQLEAAKTRDDLDAAMDLIQHVADLQQREELGGIVKRRLEAFSV